MKKIILIDNYDSFTFNLYHYLSSLKVHVDVIRNDQITSNEILKRKYNKIVISPGPGNPNQSGNCLKIVKSLYKKRVNVEGDAGVDLYFPEEVVIPAKALGLKVDLKIQAEMVQEVNSQLMTNIPKEMLKEMNIEERSLSYMVVPRSSIIKTPLRMSNSIGVMDAGYRGNFMVPIDNLSDEDFI